MRMQYLNGKEADDRLFDLSPELQRAQVARYMNLNPDTPDDWPISMIDSLIAVRRLFGQKQFYLELGRALSPS